MGHFIIDLQKYPTDIVATDIIDVLCNHLDVITIFGKTSISRHIRSDGFKINSVPSEIVNEFKMINCVGQVILK